MFHMGSLYFEINLEDKVVPKGWGMLRFYIFCFSIFRFSCFIGSGWFDLGDFIENNGRLGG